MKNVHIIKNLFINDALSHMRDERTDLKTFRFFADELSYLLVSNCLLSSDMEEKDIRTPVHKTRGVTFMEDFVIIPILRSGIAMLPTALKLLPCSKVGFAGIYRDEETAVPHEYYWKLPHILANDSILIIDPMLATGGSILSVLRKLKNGPQKDIRIISIVAAPEGIKAIHKEFPDIPIFLAALDERLNDEKYIVPGLGDFGDRYFDTPTEKERVRKGEPDNRHWYE